MPLDHRVVVSSARSAAVDMALLQSCDHHVITVGSFSSWSVFLGGETVRMDIKETRNFVDERFNITRRNGRSISMAILNSNQDVQEMKDYIAKL